MQEGLSRLLVFSKLNSDLQRKIVTEMHERTVQAGEILINEGDTGLAATELYVVKSGKFEVSCEIANDRQPGSPTISAFHVTGLAKAARAERPREHEGQG